MTPTQAVERLVAASVRLSDADLDRPYVWHDYDGDGLRFSLLTAHHLLRETTATCAAARLAAGEPFSEGQRILAQVHEAYRDLSGALAGTTDADLDRDPGAGQWTLRAVLAHGLGADSAFLTAIVLALDAVRAGRLSERSTKEKWESREVPVEDPSGSRGDVLNALFRSHTAILLALDTVSDAELDTPSFFWESEPYPIRFRMHRFEEHWRQHTIQLDKTLAAIGHPPTEAERLVRNIYNALAGLESVTSGVAVGGDLAAGCARSVVELAHQVESAAR
ncbi:MAG TPA: DinB family protein [Candidatus Limnocylindria bacterium]|nr:DinB family protein [Candidatus Limnocylindria bacterium]